MTPTASSHMQTEVLTISSAATLVELERVLGGQPISGLPVVDAGRLVGVVSRADLVRRIAVEQSRAEIASEYYRDMDWASEGGGAESDGSEVGAMAGQHLQGLHVRDVMSTELISVAPETSLQEAAKIMLARRIHRLLVTSGSQLVGILSSLDLLRFIAEGDEASNAPSERKP